MKKKVQSQILVKAFNENYLKYYWILKDFMKSAND